MLHRDSIRKKTLQVACSTLVSRFFGFLREFLMIRYLGAGVISDAFITAFKIPNSLRKIFAEGALSAALVPTFVKLIKKDKSQAHSLMTLSFIIFEGMLLVVCIFIFWKADLIMRVLAPGWYIVEKPEVISSFKIPVLNTIASGFFSIISALTSSSEKSYQIEVAIKFLRILISFILFLSTSALFASVLQASNHFFIPAFAQIVINIVIIVGLLICSYKQLPVEYLCYFIIFGAFLHCLLHVVAYIKLRFSFGRITEQTVENIKQVLAKFLPCLFTMSIMEIHLLIDTSVGSYLSEGSISLIYYANRFMGIPLGIFSTAFSTVLLPHFSKIGIYAPKRLSYFFLEAAKFIGWATLPATFLLSFLAEPLFKTLGSNKLSSLQIQDASTILLIFLLGLFFFSINKILLNMYYAQHNTVIPVIISLLVTILNFILSSFFLMPYYGAQGIALATTISGIVQTILSIIGLRLYFDFILYTKPLLIFFKFFILQFFCAAGLFLCSYWIIMKLILLLPISLKNFFIGSLGFWLWMMPLCALIYLFLYKTRSFFNIKLYFLE